MGISENKALVRAHYEATVNAFDEAAIDQQVADEFVDHAAGEKLGPDGVKRHIRGLQAVFPDLRVTIEDMIAEGDRVAVRATWRGTHKGDFRGVPASHQPIEFSGMVFWRIAENKIVERWASVDVLGPVRRAAEHR